MMRQYPGFQMDTRPFHIRNNGCLISGEEFKEKIKDLYTIPPDVPTDKFMLTKVVDMSATCVAPTNTPTSREGGSR